MLDGLDDIEWRRLGLSRSPAPWLIDGEPFGNVALLVEEYGLPDDRTALTA
ncbi:hypothetical protein [Micromonospora musae]|uniref:hypothetical protein n=1 Tax=Micromonospora musae TaxID=1894970 RepID=UPI0033E6AA79